MSFESSSTFRLLVVLAALHGLSVHVQELPERLRSNRVLLAVLWNLLTTVLLLVCLGRSILHLLVAAPDGAASSSVASLGNVVKELGSILDSMDHNLFLDGRHKRIEVNTACFLLDWHCCALLSTLPALES